MEYIYLLVGALIGGGVIFFLLIYLDCRILGVYLSLDKCLQMLGRPDIKTQPLADSGNFQANMLL